ncbi:polysaccharide biosynthesis C-terminal domain-containing protein [Hymenobacter sp. BT175]|uniref:lipopolysaccharide biosynthesis protein n=1 Tax=Hymenobacter translucens TaxID=2886507 RepID=UPI001D0E008C|nr:polysaccharide biosynthesis C-terminal domain-containing protein [Hymenobacter translucens]MCC2545240.1 polysaccharide biosynthesis C-terminal domain-containing protein [Hymenobacter translucens]
MGIVQRQGLRNTIISYLGLGLGFVNTAFILPRLLAPDQVGLTRVLVSIATIYAQLAAFGFANTGVRFFPYFRNRENGHHGFLPLLLGLPLLGFAVVTLGFWLGRPLIMGQYAKDAALLGPYYGWVIALALFTLLYNLQDAYLRALYHSAFSSFMQEIVLRVLIVGAALLFGQGLISFHAFVLAYIGAYSVISLLLTLYLLRIGELHLKPNGEALRVRPLGELLGFGGFALLSNLSGTIIGSIDALMVGSRLGLAAAGIYSIAFFISTALSIPFRSLYKIAFPLLADYWKENAMGKMADFYQRTTRLNTAVGCWLALGIGLNLDFIYSLMKPEYAAGATSVILLLLGRLIDGITGVNGLIVVTSPRYRYDLFFNLSLALTTVLMNLLLIPPFGLTGAALATLLAMTSINLARTWFVWHSYRLQPFDRTIPLLVLAAAAAGGAAWWMPPVHSVFVTMLLRSAVLTGLYGSAVLGLKLLPEAQTLVNRIIPGRFRQS